MASAVVVGTVIGSGVFKKAQNVAANVPEFGLAMGVWVLGGLLALLGALDTGLWMLPWIPISPAWLRLLLELIWIPSALVVVLRHPRAMQAAPTPLATS